MPQGDTMVVETATGPVRGEHKRGAFRVKGIPFAAPPVGELRFRPPRPVQAWSRVHDGTGRFPIAPQPMAGMEAAAGGAGGSEQSEAGCLTLNVWTPAADDGRRPVLFWIHGGAFVTGAGTVPWYDGSNLTARDVVVVTINYRLGALGFLELGSVFGDDLVDSGNVGLLDQIAALEWVRDNIAAFGGDAGNVTIAGESAGGMSVATLLGTPQAQGLFHKAIPQSGAASHVSDRGRAAETAEKILAGLRVDDVESLRAVPADRLVEVQSSVALEGGIGAGLPFQPVAGGQVLPQPPLEAITGGLSTGVPLLSGTTRHEMRLFTALDPRLGTLDRERLERMVAEHAGDRTQDLLTAYEAEGAMTDKELLEAASTDWVFRMPALDLLEAQEAHAATYAYEFWFESAGFGGGLGAAHAVEIPFMFDNLDAAGASFFVGEPTDEMRTLAAAMADAWAAFAHDGRPVADGLPAWPEFHRDDRETMILDLGPRVVGDPAAPVRELWRPSA